MRLTAINCVILVCTAVVLAEESRPRRHLHKIKEMIVNKLFSSSEPNWNYADPPLETKFFKIPGFNDVVIKAVPKGSNPEPTPVYEKLPPNSHIEIVGSYLGTRTLNETYNALLGVKNLLTSGILSGKPEVLQEVGLVPSKVQFIARPVKPCAAPPAFSPLPLNPVRVLVEPPRVPVVPTQYSYKQVNQDGSLKTYTSSLNLENGVKVIEDGKTLPFFIDRVRKIPVRLPVPVLPEVSKIIVPEMVHPATYSYQQIHQDGRMTSYMGLPSLIRQPDSVVVTETGAKIPPPPVFLMDRIENVADIASYPRASFMAVAPKPMEINAAVLGGGSVPVPGPTGYSYSQMNVNGGMTTHSATGVKKASVLVTENGVPTAPLNAPSLPEKNPFKAPAGYGAYSYIQVHGDAKTSFDGLGVPGPVNVVERKPISISPDIPPNSFSYKQFGDGKITTYTGSDSFEESYGASPAVIMRGMGHPIPPPYITDRIEKVAAGAKYNRPPYFTMPAAVPVPTGFIKVPSVHTSHPKQPVKIPTTPGTNSFVYKHVHNDGSVTTYGSDGLTAEEGNTKLPPVADTAMPFPQSKVSAFKSSMYTGPFPMNSVNPNAIKPSTPVPGTTGYSYSQMNVNGGMTTHSATGVKKASVLVTENGVPTAPLNAPSLPEKNPFKAPAGYGAYSYIQVHGDGKTSFDGLGVPGPVNVVEREPIFVSPDIPFPPNSFSYKQIGDGKITTYTGSDTFEESYGASPAVIMRGMGHPIPPPYITDRIEKVAAGAKYNQPPYFTMPAAVPVPTGFVKVPSVHASHPQRPVKIPTTSGMNSFVYKHVHNDGSVTSYGSDGLNAEEGKAKLPPAADTEMPFPPRKVSVFESPMYTGPFHMNSVNPNAIKPSTPVSGTYSYKSKNSNFQENHPPVGPIYGPFVDTFAPPPPTSMPAPIRGCNDPEIFNPVVHHDSPATTVPLSYSYKQISQNNLDPFLVVNVEDPVMGVTNPNVGFSQNNQGSPSMPLTPPLNQFPTVNDVEYKSTGFVQPTTFESAPITKMPVPQGPMKIALPSSFSYKSVTNQAHQHQAPPQHAVFNAVEHNPKTFVPPRKSDGPLPQAPTDSSPSSSFSYKQVTSQAYQPLPSAQPTINDMEHRPRGPSVLPSIINMRTPEIQKDKAPSSFSYKQATSQGVYEYFDEFPTGVKTNLPPTTMSPLGNPSGHVYFEQKPLPNPTMPTPVSESPTSVPSRLATTFNRKDSLANNPIIVPDSSPDSSFSFKSTNPDGSMITVKNDGHNSIAGQVQETPKTEAVSQEPTIQPSVTAEPYRMVTALKESVTTSAPEETTGIVSEHAKPMRRRVIKRVKPVSRGDIPDDE